MVTPVVFKVGTRAQYDALQEKNPNALYFLTDTREIYHGAAGLAQNGYLEDIKTTEATDEEVIENFFLKGTSENPRHEVKGDIFVVKTLVGDGVYSQNAYVFDGQEWQSISSSVIADDKSVELNGGVLTLKDYGKRYYKHIAETGSEEEGNLVPAHYELVEVDAEHVWAAGLEPKVVLENNEYVIGWFEPNPTTVEGVQGQVSAVQGTVADLQNTVTDVREDLTETQEEVKTLGEEVDSITDALYGTEGENPTEGLIANVAGLEQNLAENYYTKDEVYSKEQIDGKVAGVFHFKGAVDAFENLPEEKVEGDVYQVADKEYAWNGTEWVELGFVMDLSSYATLEAVEKKLKEVTDELGAVDGDLEKVTEDVADHEDRLSAVESTLNAEETGLVTVVGDLEGRVQTLELVGAEKNVIVGVAINGTALTPNESRVVELPVFDGENIGLVPVAGEDIEDKAVHFLNAEGDWTAINIGDLGAHKSVVEYVNAAVAAAVPVWGNIVEE